MFSNNSFLFRLTGFVCSKLPPKKRIEEILENPLVLAARF